jgi:hypothetical protein
LRLMDAVQALHRLQFDDDSVLDNQVNAMLAE